MLLAVPFCGLYIPLSKVQVFNTHNRKLIPVAITGATAWLWSSLGGYLQQEQKIKKAIDSGHFQENFPDGPYKEYRVAMQQNQITKIDFMPYIDTDKKTH